MEKLDIVYNLSFDDILNGEENSIIFFDAVNKEKFLKKIEDFANKEEKKICCFTGNRPSNLPWKYNESCEFCKTFKENLRGVLEVLISYGFNYFISGMAMGVDIIAAEIVLELKKNYQNVKLECALPCLTQTKGWGLDYIKRYENVLKNSDKIEYVSNVDYFAGCYNKRNQYMVDKSSVVVAGLFTIGKGTKSTIEYAKKQGKRIIILK